MLNKIEINNELICMKKIIQKAKGFVSQKLIKKLKDLKTKLKTDTQPKNLKFVGQTAKIEYLLKQLKQTNNLQLASQVLTFQSDPQRILTNASSTIDDLLLAHLCTQKLLQTEVHRLKEKYNLATIPNWHAAILEIGKKKQKRIAKVEVKRKNVERRAGEQERRDLNRKRNEWLVENLKPGDLSNCGQPLPFTDAIAKDEFSDRPKLASKKVQSQQILLKDSPVKLARKLASEPVKKVDSFFITGSGQNYLSTAVVDRVQAPTSNGGLDRRARRAQQFGKSTGGTHKRLQVQARFTNQQSHHQSQVKGFTVATTTVLHPSWAAKQKTKGIASFQGKKMKFDETIDAAPPTHAIASAKPITSDEKLHPSWAAKQIQKPTITEFKGKKITFDD